MTTQLTLPTMKKTIEERFKAFDESNPAVYAGLVRLARGLVEKGHKHISIAMCYETLRWQTMMETTGEGGFKLNDNFKSRYVRLIEKNEPDLVGVFEKRRMKAE